MQGEAVNENKGMRCVNP